ncbi:hypothetical protein BJV82DRAFT_578791 [Fennellomyces sp. T-0311]|nr:hypothetical protein BJV82DRAFT_578791 [Fennellomyces sp. T-0311]
MEELVTAIQQINLEPYHELIQRLSKTIASCNYQQVVNDASTAINEVFRTQLLILFDIRSHAQSMLGHYELACADAQRMIEYAPTQAEGFIRQGDIYSMYGRHSRAIEVYDEGLRNAISDQGQIDRLVASKAATAAKIERRVDFFARLPAEIVNAIIMGLPQNTKAICLTVSAIWRKRMLACADAWRSLSVWESPEDFHIMGATTYIGPYIKHMTIDTSNERMRTGLFEHMAQGFISKIHSVKFTAPGTLHLQRLIDGVIPAFWQARHTLKVLDFDLGNNVTGITLASILNVCSSVTDLSYRTYISLQYLAGDFTIAEQHNSLVNLRLKSRTITGDVIRNILQRCPQLKRLVMTGCEPTVLDAVRMHAVNLEILAYNAASQIPELQTLGVREKPGLRVVYANDEGTIAVPHIYLLPLLFKHMSTLENVFVYLPALPANELAQVIATYPGFTLDSVKRLSFWPLDGVQSFMLRAIQNTRTLTHLSVASVHDLDALLKTLLGLPPLTTLRMAHIRSTNNRAVFNQLFQKYATLSRSQPSLRSATFRYCYEITDEMLVSLAQIQTLREVSLCGLRSLTTAGINTFLGMVSGQLEYIRLVEMNFITDDNIANIGNMNILDTVHLEGLRHVTDRGIRSLVDRMDHKLDKLSIRSCPLVTDDSIRYAEKKILIIQRS